MRDKDDAPSGVSLKEWLPVLSATALIVGAAWFQGGLATQQTESTRRINVLEQRVETIQQIDVRTTRIEAKLDMLTAQDGHQRGEPERAK